ncbi:MAG: hypothetical protein AAFN68_13370 [Pseudomonadota bacterium]
MKSASAVTAFIQFLYRQRSMSRQWLMPLQRLLPLVLLFAAAQTNSAANLPNIEPFSAQHNDASAERYGLLTSRLYDQGLYHQGDSPGSSPANLDSADDGNTDVVPGGGLNNDVHHHAARAFTRAAQPPIINLSYGLIRAPPVKSLINPHN